MSLGVWLPVAVKSWVKWKSEAAQMGRPVSFRFLRQPLCNQQDTSCLSQGKTTSVSGAPPPPPGGSFGPKGCHQEAKWAQEALARVRSVKKVLTSQHPTSNPEATLAGHTFKAAVPGTQPLLKNHSDAEPLQVLLSF